MDNPIGAFIAVAAVSLIPFALVMLTSFVKLSVVLSLLRNALGVPQVPPTIVITGLAVMLTAFIMAPIGARVADTALPVLDRARAAPALSDEAAGAYREAAALAAEPVREFLAKHAHDEDRAMFAELAQRLRDANQPRLEQNQPAPADAPPASPDAVAPEAPLAPADSRAPEQVPAAAAIDDHSLVVLAPAFVTSELTEAFAIGFLLFLPFLIIDLVVANALMALGMPTLSTASVSLPFKLLLFVAVDGWALVVRGLILGYA